LLFWVKTKAPTSHLAFEFGFPDTSILGTNLGTTNGTWQFIALVKEGLGAKVYVNAIHRPALDLAFLAQPDAWAVTQLGDDTHPYAIGDVDEVLLYDEALTQNQIYPIMFPPDRMVLYTLNDVPFLDYNVYVSESKGVVDGLEMKTPTTVDWAASHGLQVDLARPRFNSREIELSCFMQADGMIDFTMKLDGFLKQFVRPGLHRLRIGIDERKPLVYELYCPNVVAVDKKWNALDMIGTFKLNLVDPEPIRRVLRFKGATVTVSFKSNDVFNIFWGDGANEIDVESGTFTHTYSNTTKFHEIIIAGEIDNITDFKTNAVLIWSRL
jgi:hypothetical protein